MAATPCTSPTHGPCQVDKRGIHQPPPPATPAPELPGFPRPDLPVSHPENYPTLKIRVMRRLGLPDDGGMYLSDAISPDILRGYNGLIARDDADRILIDFASLGDAVSWA